MLTASARESILQLANYLKGHWEDPDWGRRPEDQVLIGLALRQLASGLQDTEARHRITDAANRVISSNSARLEARATAATPLTDFLATLADPETLDRFRRDPQRVVDEVGLSPEDRAAVLAGIRGPLRLRGIWELERAGLSPLISDRFTAGVNLQIANMTINTNNFDTTNITINTTVTTTITNHNDNTTTHTKHWPDTAIDSVAAAARYFASQPKNPGSLVVVGSGIRAIRDLTLAAEWEIRFADKVLYCVADPVTERRIHELNRTAESLYDLYGNGKPRVFTYREMVETILRYVRQGMRVCVVFYGHPGMFAWSTHEAIRIAREEGRRAELLPGISTEASLFADLAIDPSHFGWQAFDATEMLINNRTIDTACNVLIWQAECAGDSGFNFTGYRKHNFEVLLEHLRKFYPADHTVIVYDASPYPHLPPEIQQLTLATIGKEHLSGISTLYLPPARTPQIDEAMCEKLGLRVVDEDFRSDSAS